MMHYETLLLLDVDSSDADISTLEKQVSDLVKTGKGSLKSFDKWGRYRLAYPIRKKDYGVYALVRYEVADEAAPFFKKFETHLRVKCNDLVMRHVHVRLTPEEFAAEYVRPESVEQAAQNESFRKDDRRGHRGPRVPRESRESREAQSEKATEAPVAKEATTDAVPAADAQSAEG